MGVLVFNAVDIGTNAKIKATPKNSTVGAIRSIRGEASLSFDIIQILRNAFLRNYDASSRQEASIESTFPLQTAF